MDLLTSTDVFGTVTTSMLFFCHKQACRVVATREFESVRFPFCGIGIDPSIAIIAIDYRPRREFGTSVFVTPACVQSQYQQGGARNVSH